MKGTGTVAVVISLTCGLSVSAAWCASTDGAVSVAVQASPHTILLGLDTGSAITVHTDIALGAVERSSVALSGVPANATSAGSCVSLVAKFRQADIEAIVGPPSATLALTGVTKDGVPFSGSDTIRVIKNPSAD